MLLARLVQRHRGCDAAEALRLAADLARTLDQLLIEEVDPARLAELRRRAARAFDPLAEVARPAPADPRRLAGVARRSAAGSTSPTGATGCSTRSPRRWRERAAGRLRLRRRHHHRRARGRAAARRRGAAARGHGGAARRSISSCPRRNGTRSGRTSPTRRPAAAGLRSRPIRNSTSSCCSTG